MRYRRMLRGFVRAWPAAMVLAWQLACQPAVAAADCPAQATPPTAAELRAGLPAASNRGLLWRLDKDGRTGWLYGTLHVGRAGWAVPGPRVAQALREADTLALELDLADPAVGAELARGMAELQRRSAQQPLPTALHRRLAAWLRAECLDSPGFDAQPPLMQALALGVLAGRRDGLDPAFAQEVGLGTLAHASGQAVVSLETPGGQLAALADGDATARDESIAQLLDELDSGQARRLLRRSAEAWARGDLAMLQDYAAWCECADTEADRARMRRLNDERNPALAEAIDALLARGRRVFAAVGALHMTGPMALPLLLERRGWQVRRIELSAE